MITLDFKDIHNQIYNLSEIVESYDDFEDIEEIDDFEYEWDDETN